MRNNFNYKPARKSLPTSGVLLLFVLASLCLFAGAARAAGGFTTLNMRGVVNMAYRDEVQGDGIGWTNQGDNDMRNMPLGAQTFLGIPFDIIEPATNHGKGVLTMQSRNFPAGPAQVTVPVNATAQSIYFLQAAAWLDGHVLDYLVHYADGTSVNIPIEAKVEISDWWGPQNYEKCRIAFHVPNNQNDDMGMVIFGWNNPNPEKTITAIDIKSPVLAPVPLVAAITLSDKAMTLPDAKDIPMPDYMKPDTDLLDKTQWFPVPSVHDTFNASPIDVSATLDAPAGKHGFLQNKDGRFVFEDGTPAKLVAVGEGDFFPATRERARYMARWLAKFGFNQLRFHALVPGVCAPSKDNTSTLDPAKLAKLDVFIDELAKAGIYVRFSMIYYRGMVRGDGADAYDQLLKFNNKQGNDQTINTSTMTFFDPKIMQMNIDLEKAIMTHHNPYRLGKDGKPLMYGEDPAISMIETCNEDSMFFYTTDGLAPYYKQELNRLWNAWLKKKYHTQADLVKAWGPDSLFELEQLDMGTVKRVPIGNYSNRFPDIQVKRAADMLRFYAELNNNFFTKTKATLRAAGVKQPINGTCWFGPDLAYWADIYSNTQGMDYIDRHHYWGGGPGEWQIVPLPFNPASALNSPETILKLSSERVMEMPFGVSEWANTLPNQFRVADPMLMAFYGNCLNGWDIPVIFSDAINEEGFNTLMKWMWPVSDPETLCQYPTLSTVIRRGDIKEGQTVFVRNFSDEMTFGAKPLPDVGVKFQTSGIFEVGQSANVSEKALVAYYAAGVGKTGISFTHDAKPDFSPIDLTKYIDLKKKEIRSQTGQLLWNYDTGYVTANAPLTQAVTGFVTNLPMVLDDCTILTSNEIATIYVTSWDGKPLKESKHILITALGRNRNPDMVYSRGGQHLISRGDTGPVLQEGIKGTVTLNRTGAVTVTALSPAGYKTVDVTPTIQDGKIVIPLDGTNKAVYYDVVFQ